LDQSTIFKADARAPLFDSFFMGGFECSDHLLEDGRRLDLIASTRHDELASADYARLLSLGMSSCRDGISWVRTEPRRGELDFSSFLPRLRAAQAMHGLRTVIWDLMHFGYPDHVDVFAVEFPERFARFASAVARFMADEIEPNNAPFFSLINEMSFFSWAAGDVKVMYPFALARGDELKVQLVLATIAGIESIREVFPHARFVHAEPLINIVASPDQPRTWRKVECDNALQYEALDMLSGRVWPRLGGHPKYLDIVGVNYYPDNQFTLDGTTVAVGDARYVPLSRLLMETYSRYRRPMILAETGSEGDGRADWLRYVSAQCMEALERGCELHGVTLYPILDHAGWLDNRHCPNGLWGYADESGYRPLHEPLALELSRQEPLLHAARDRMLARRSAPNLTQANHMICDAY
jgi:hypothetical protein